MPENKKVQVDKSHTRAMFVPETFSEENRTIEVTFATETAVRTFDWDAYESVDEVLVCMPENGDLTRLNNGAPVLDNHNRYGKTNECVVGVVESARFENNKGIALLRFGKSDDDTELMEKVRDGIITGISVGYNVKEYQVTRAEGQTPIYRATKWQATEISFTPVQADINSRVRSEDSKSEAVIIENTPEPIQENTEEKEEIINLNIETMPEIEKTAADAAVLEQTRSAAVTAERQRVSGITGLTRALGLESKFTDTLIEEGVTVEVAQTRALAEWETKQPLNPNQTIEQVHTAKEATRSAMTNALVLRVDPKASAVLGADNVRAAGEFRGMSLLRLAEESLKRSNINTNGMSGREIAQAALGGRVRGLHHTTDFPLLLGDSFTRTLRAQYMLQARTFEAWARRVTLPDFRTITRVQLSGLIGNFDQVQEGGEYKNGTMSEVGESYKLAKYGKIVGITWEMIINDDLSAFTRIPQAFASKSAQKQSDIVYSILTGNPVMADGLTVFQAAAHKNYTSTGTVLAEASLDVAYQLFRTQKSIEGDFLNLAPKFLVVGPKNELIARKLTSTNYVPVKQGDISVAALTGLTPVVDPRITDYSWFLIADPAAIDTVEYAFLDSEEELFTEQRDGFEVDGIEIKARMVFAAKAIDYRGMYKNNGAAPV